jgi:RNA polymerase sigma-70 factor (ECF subfamily)
MDDTSGHEATRLLKAWSGGDEAALQQLIPLVYEELRRVARRHIAAEGRDHTLPSSALVHEVYLRLLNVREISWQNRAHFLAICARLMRQVLIDFARAKSYQKRGGNAVLVPCDETITVSSSPGADIVALDDALKALADFDQRKSRVVELRFFGGLSVQETAEVLNVAPETVMRDWKLAKVWLLRELSCEIDHAAGTVEEN